MSSSKNGGVLNCYEEQVYKNKSHELQDLFYDGDMIEELDLLAKRIQGLVLRVKSLASESAMLKQQLASITVERDDLAKKLQAEIARQTELEASLGSVQSAMQHSKVRAQQDQAALQGTLDLFKQENETMQTSLKRREDEVRRLREVNQQARQRVDGVLERLPGALSQEVN